jgi:alcohol dehydrogenase class IV
MEESNFELRKFVAPEFIIGVDARLLVGRYAKNFGSRHVFVVTDSNLIAAGWVKDVTDSLRAEGIRYTLFSDVTPNPRDYQVADGADLYQRSGCDCIVAVGGGSPIDCAKGIGIVVSNKKHILEFEGVDNVVIPPPPLICVPTTAGSGADVSQFAIINDTERKVKIAIISKKIVPDIALIDPIPLTTLPTLLTLNTGLDAIVHSVESYVSNASSPVTDVQALESIRLMTTYLLPALNEPEKIEFRYRTMLGSLLAGLAFSNSSLGAVHAMAHSLGGFSDLPHGACNAVLLEHVVAYNYPACPRRYDTLAEIIGVELSGLNDTERKMKIIAAVKTFKEKMGMTETLGDLGITRMDIQDLAKKAIRDPCMVTNPRQPTIKDIEQIYEAAL